MFSKYTIALTAMLLAGGTAIATAFEDPENRIGDRYPFLEKIDRSAHGAAVAQRTAIQRNAKLDLYTSEDVENKIADRYPFLEQTAGSAAAAAVRTQRVFVRRNAKLDLYMSEQPENKIADRYPFLEQTVTIAGAARPAASAKRMSSAAKNTRKASFGRQGTRSVY